MKMIIDLVGRAASLVRTHLPWLLLIALIDLSQRVAEIRGGVFGGDPQPDSNFYHLAFGPIKVFALFLLITVACRYWVIGARVKNATALVVDMGRTLVVLAGHVITIMIILSLATLVADAAGNPMVKGQPIIIILAMVIIWLPLHSMLIPWYVGFICRDPDMSLVRAVKSMALRLPAAIGIFLAGFLPFNVAHGALELSMIGKAEVLVWPAMAVIDPMLVAAIGAFMAASYHASYARAKDAEYTSTRPSQPQT